MATRKRSSRSSRGPGSRRAALGGITAAPARLDGRKIADGHLRVRAAMKAGVTIPYVDVRTGVRGVIMPNGKIVPQRGALHGDARRRSGNWEGDDEETEGEDDFDLKTEMREGVVIGDARGGGYRVSESGKYIGSRPSFDEALKFAAQKMEDGKFFPNIFYVNERGNVDLLSIRPKIVKGKVIKVPYEIARSWV
jgi:hypothetical protein